MAAKAQRQERVAAITDDSWRKSVQRFFQAWDARASSKDCPRVKGFNMKELKQMLRDVYDHDEDLDQARTFAELCRMIALHEMDADEDLKRANAMLESKVAELTRELNDLRALQTKTCERRTSSFRTIEDVFVLPQLTKDKVKIRYESAKALAFLARFFSGNIAGVNAVACLPFNPEYVEDEENLLPTNVRLRLRFPFYIDIYDRGEEIKVRGRSPMQEDEELEIPDYPAAGHIWSLHVAKGMREVLVEECEGSRFILFLVAANRRHEAHMNAAIIDTKRGTLERLEPNGAGFGMGNSDDKVLSAGLDEGLEAFNRDVLGDKYNYIGVFGSCAWVGPQALQAESTVRKGGYCVAWSVLVMLTRILNPDVDGEQVQELMIGCRSADDLKLLIRRFILLMDEMVPGEEDEPTAEEVYSPTIARTLDKRNAAYARAWSPSTAETRMDAEEKMIRDAAIQDVLCATTKQPACPCADCRRLQKETYSWNLQKHRASKVAACAI